MAECVAGRVVRARRRECVAGRAGGRAGGADGGVGIFNILKNVFGHLLPLPLPLPLPLSMSMSMSMSKSAGPLRQRRGEVRSAITKKGPGWVSKRRPSVSEGYALPAELEVQVRVV